MMVGGAVRHDVLQKRELRCKEVSKVQRGLFEGERTTCVWTCVETPSIYDTAGL